MFSKLVSCSIALTLSVSAASNRLIVFGNSLSDIGNIEGVKYAVPWFPGRFSNGPVWNEYLAYNNNYTLINYSIGGATSNNTFSNGLSGGNVTIPSVVDQVLLFNSTFGGKFNSSSIEDDIVVIEIGSNDVLGSALALATGQVQTEVFTTGLVNNILYGVNFMANLGYKKFILTDIPDIQKTPSAQILGQTGGTTLNNYVVAANNLLSSTAASLVTSYNGSIDYIRVAGIYKFLKVVSDTSVSAALNLENTKDSCYVVVNNTLASSCNNSNDYLFMDGVHPTTRVHALFSAIFEKVIENPSFDIVDSNLIDLIKANNISSVSSTQNYLFSDSSDNTSPLKVDEYTIKNATANAAFLTGSSNQSSS
ncbi:Thermolabile hemolysin, partial [Smittium culicis]